MTAYLHYVCLLVHTMAGYLYYEYVLSRYPSVCLPVWYLASCIMSSSFVCQSAICLSTCMTSATCFMYCFLYLWCLATCTIRCLVTCIINAWMTSAYLFNVSGGVKCPSILIRTTCFQVLPADIFPVLPVGILLICLLHPYILFAVSS